MASSETTEAQKTNSVNEHNKNITGIYRQIGWLDDPYRPENQLTEPCTNFELLDTSDFTMQIDMVSGQILKIGQALQEWAKWSGHTPMSFVRRKLWHKVYSQMDIFDGDYYNTSYRIQMPIPGQGTANININVIIQKETESTIIDLRCYLIQRQSTPEAEEVDYQVLRVNHKNLYHAELDPDFNIVRVDGEGLKLFDINSEMLVGLNMLDLVDMRYGMVAEVAMDRIKQGKIAQWSLPSNNQVINGVFVPVLDANRKLIKILNFSFVSEANLGEASDFILNDHELFNTLNIKHAEPTVLLDVKGILLDTNIATNNCFSTKYGISEILHGSSFINLILPISADITADIWDDYLQKKQDFEIIDLQLNSLNGPRYCHVKAFYITLTTSQYYFIELLDITDAYNVNLSIKRSEMLLKTILELAQVGIVVTDFEFQKVKIINPSLLSIMALEDEAELESRIEIVWENKLNDPRLTAMQNLIRKAQSDGYREGDFTAEVGTKMAHISAKIKTFDWNEKKWLMGLVQDKTTEKNILAHAQKQEQRFTAIFKSSIISTMVYDTNTLELVEINDATKKIFNHEHNTLLPKLITDILPDICLYEDARNNPEINTDEDHFVFKTMVINEQQFIHLEVNCYKLPFDLYERNVRLVKAINITDSVNLTASLLNQKETLRSIFDKIPYPIFLKDSQLRYILVNHYFMDNIAKDETDLIGKTDAEIFEPSESDQSFYQTDLGALQGNDVGFEHSAKLNDETKLYWTIKRNITLAGYGSCILGISTDLTELKTTELKLNESQALFQDLFQSSQDALFVVEGADIKMVDCNQAAVEMFGAVNKEELLGFDCHKLPVDNEENRKAFAELYGRQREESKNVDVLYQSFTGRQFWGSVAIMPLASAERNALIRIVDVTATKNLIKRIEDSLGEKDMLLREIHHRVKNNLAVIISLLNLQNYQITDPEINTMFVECMNRIRSMAILHEELYSNTNLSKIDFVSYLKNLSKQITGTIATGVMVNVGINGDGIMLDILRAVPCGLIMNELITNSYKHAFNDQKTGNILINLSTDDDQIIIDYSDDGTGKTAHLDPSAKFSLGCLLITELSKQIKAIVTESSAGQKMQLVNDHQTGYHIRLAFPKS